MNWSTNGMLGCSLLVLGLLAGFAARLQSHASAIESTSQLDKVLLHLSPDDPFTCRDLTNGGVFIAGRVGSGKTSSSGTEVAKAIVNHKASKNHKASGGLILAAKPEDLAMWKKIFADADRSNDLRVFSPSEPLRMNFLDYEMRHGGHTRNITQCITTLGEGLRSGGSNRGNEDGAFWEQQAERMIFNAVEIVKLATGKVTAPDLQRFIVDAATTREMLSNAEWRKGFHYQCLDQADKSPKNAIAKHDFDLASEYWLGEIPGMADRTQSSILTFVLGILHVFNTGVVRDLVSGETNITPDDMLDGLFVLVDMSPSEWGTIGAFISTGWKYLTQRRILRREAKADDSINAIWADEASQFVNKFDAQYITQCRSHLGCMIFLNQSLAGFYAAFGEKSGENHVHSLLANFTHTIVHAVDPQTAHWAASKLGQKRESFFGGSINPSVDLYDALLGNGGTSGNFNTSYAPVLQDSVFMNGLRTGGKVNGLACDAIVIKSGEPFASGENYLFRTFFQG